jgi:hypothetical protein
VASIDAYEEQVGASEISIGQHYTLVKRIAYHLRTRLPASIATDDLIQAGMEGLIHAQRAYEPSRGIEFEMFAKTRIRGAMLDEGATHLLLNAFGHSPSSASKIRQFRPSARNLGDSPRALRLLNFWTRTSPFTKRSV